MLININSLPLVSEKFMNTTHIEDVNLINSLYKSIIDFQSKPSEKNKISINEKYNKWFEHTILHFKVEEDLMKERDFPPYQFHKAEHDKTLTQMDRVYREWCSNNNIDILKNFLEKDLVEWLINHINSMDNVTSTFFTTGLSPCNLNQRG